MAFLSKDVDCGTCSKVGPILTRGIVVQYQYQEAGIGKVVFVFKSHIYPKAKFYMQGYNQK
jgi:hypothetical protein